MTLAGCVSAPSSEQGDAATERPTPAEVPAPAAVTVPPARSGDIPHRPSVGECFDMRKDELSLRDALVPCATAHDDEIYAQFELPDDAYPGEPAVAGDARAGCIERFATFVGVPYEASVLEVTTFHPGSDSWAAGDRVVSCSVWNPDAAVVGTLSGAAY
jgi:hypothetical protein